MISRDSLTTTGSADSEYHVSLNELLNAQNLQEHMSKIKTGYTTWLEESYTQNIIDLAEAEVEHTELEALLDNNHPYMAVIIRERLRNNKIKQNELESKIKLATSRINRVEPGAAEKILDRVASRSISSNNINQESTITYENSTEIQGITQEDEEIENTNTQHINSSRSENNDMTEYDYDLTSEEFLALPVADEVILYTTDASDSINNQIGDNSEDNTSANNAEMREASSSAEAREASSSRYDSIFGTPKPQLIIPSNPTTRNFIEENIPLVEWTIVHQRSRSAVSNNLNLTVSNCTGIFCHGYESYLVKRLGMKIARKTASKTTNKNRNIFIRFKSQVMKGRKENKSIREIYDEIFKNNPTPPLTFSLFTAAWRECRNEWEQSSACTRVIYVKE